MSNQTSKYFKYAIGEIVLVVIGILIALQINNWNDNRNNLNREKNILAGIHQEFLQNKKQLDSVVQLHTRVLESCQKIMTLFPIQSKPNKKTLDSLSNYLYFSYGGTTFNPSQSSIHALTSTSSFDIISNKLLRKHLISWSDLVNDYKEEENVLRSYTWNHYDPYMQKHFDFNFNFQDSRNDFKALETLEFEFKVKSMHDLANQTINTSGELKILQNTLDKIIELSKPVTHD